MEDHSHNTFTDMLWENAREKLAIFANLIKQQQKNHSKARDDSLASHANQTMKILQSLLESHETTYLGGTFFGVEWCHSCHEIARSTPCKKCSNPTYTEDRREHVQAQRALVLSKLTLAKVQWKLFSVATRFDPPVGVMAYLYRSLIEEYCSLMEKWKCDEENYFNLPTSDIVKMYFNRMNVNVNDLKKILRKIKKM